MADDGGVVGSGGAWYMELYYELCLSCPLPDCDPNSALCPRRAALAAHSGHERIPDGYLTTAEMGERLGLSTPSMCEYLQRYGRIMGAYQCKYGKRGGPTWLAREDRVRWLARCIGRDYVTPEGG